MSKERYLQIFAWSLSTTVVAIAFIAWGQGLSWHLTAMRALDLFPLFGLMAFSLMWAHYLVSAVRQYLGIDKAILHTYIEVTSLIVLIAIFAHPGILEWTLWHQGLGLPPTNVFNYVAKSMKLFAVFGMVSLLVFAAYELRRWYDKKPWWRYVGYVTDAAMLLIVVHALKLGHNLQTGWLRTVWYIYGLSLIAAMGYIYYRRLNAKHRA